MVISLVYVPLPHSIDCNQPCHAACSRGAGKRTVTVESKRSQMSFTLHKYLAKTASGLACPLPESQIPLHEIGLSLLHIYIVNKF